MGHMALKKPNKLWIGLADPILSRPYVWVAVLAKQRLRGAEAHVRGAVQSMVASKHSP